MSMSDSDRQLIAATRGLISNAANPKQAARLRELRGTWGNSGAALRKAAGLTE